MTDLPPLTDADRDASAAHNGTHAERHAEGIHLVRASTVRPTPVRWGWEKRVPIGMVTLLVGKADAGKSTLFAYITAQLTRGTLPGDLYGQPVDVAIASSEDHRAAVIVPRLQVAGADLDRVQFVESIDRAGNASDVNIDGNVEATERALVDGGCRALFVDTLVSHIPSDHDAYKEQHVRRVLTPLAKMAERLDLIFGATMHLNRREARDLLSRISGSGGFGNLARSVLLLADDPDDPGGDTRVLAHGKCNVGKKQPAMTLRVEGATAYDDDGGVVPTSRLVVLDSNNPHTTEQLLTVRESDDEAGALAEAVDFVRVTLTQAEGPTLSTTLERDAAAHGITKRTLRRARWDVLRLRPRKTAEGPWVYDPIPENEEGSRARA